MSYLDGLYEHLLASSGIVLTHCRHETINFDPFIKQESCKLSIAINSLGRQKECMDGGDAVTIANVRFACFNEGQISKKIVARRVGSSLQLFHFGWL